jgi:imidazolonepropionase-like amidohydrolase
MLLLTFALSLAAANGDTTSYAVLNHGRPAGGMLVIRSGDTVIVKYHHYDRQRGPRSETRYIIRKGVVFGGETWTLPLHGPEPVPRQQPGDRFEVVGDSVKWRVRDSVRAAVLTPATFYRLRSFTPFDQALAARFLLGRPDKSGNFLPSAGPTRLEIGADTVIRTTTGRQRVRMATIHGRGNPGIVWLDDKNELISSEVSGWFVTIRPGSEEIIPALRKIEFRYRNARGADLAKRLAPMPTSAIAIVNGDVFDSERATMLPRHTVVIRGDRIVAVGPADSIAVPPNATVIDAAGKTVMPGMVDMHTHAFILSQSAAGPAHLALGITTIRDLAADPDIAVQLRDRAATGEVLSPRVVLGGFIEGPGRWAGPSEAIVSTEAEARAWVARYDSLGYKQIKLYNLIQQDLVPAIADETHKRGMRLSGHVPRGMSTPIAVRLGFDEINHAAFLFSTFFPDSLYVPQMRAYSTVSQIVAPNVNVDGPEVTAMIDLFKERGTVIDGTWALWMSQRGPPTGAPSRADSIANKLDANYLRMLKRLFDAGVRIVPGTDGGSFNVELEWYERAGIPPAEVLKIATLVPQRVMRDDRDYGSIAVGKVADVIIVDGKPTERVSDLRKVERVFRAGRQYEVKALQAVNQ